MAVALRLFRLGKKHRPSYRIVAVDKRVKRNGAYREAIGFYDPLVQPYLLKLNKERFAYWINKGAIISEGLKKLLSKKRFKKD